MAVRTLPPDALSRRELQARLSELREQRAAEVEKMKAIIARAEGERRELSDNEAEAFDRLKRKVADLGVDVATAERNVAEAPPEPQRQILPPGTHRSDVGRDTLTLSREQRMADWTAARSRGDYSREDVERFSIGRAIRAAATGNWEGAEVERRALSEGVNASGGFWTPEPLAGRFIDLVRNQARVLQAGATTVPLESDQHAIPRLATGGTAAWRNENAAVFESEATFDRVTFTPRTLARTCLLSFELAEDMLPGAAQRIDDEIAGSLALELDRVALRGSGTAPEPRGVRNHTGVEVRTDLGANGSTPTAYDFLVRAVTGVRRDNFNPNAVIYSARTEETLALLKDTTNQPLQRPRILQDVTELVTNQIPDNLTTGTSTDTSEAYAGQWDELLIGVRPSIGVRFVREQKADTLQYRITCYLRADVQVAHGQAFAVSTGIRAV